MLRWGTLAVVGFTAWSLGGPASAAETIIPIEGEVPAGGLDHFFVPFDVPPGTLEIEVRHDDGSTTNVLDFGLRGPDGFRGWGGGNEESTVVGSEAASRSYRPGAIEPGRWEVIVGKAKIVDTPATYAIEIVLRDEPTLDPQDRIAYQHAPSLKEGPAWYAGDLHVHSSESGDARPDLDEIASFSRERGLDFVVISDHNTHTAQDYFAGVQPDHPELLLVPGVEYTTYAGHANGLGATQWVDHEIGQPGVTIEGAIAAYHEQGALFVINHPTLDLGPLCIGCAWEHDVDPATIDAVEIANGGLQPFGWMFSDDAIAFWDDLCAQGYHVAPVGGSDDHKAGVDLNQFQSPIGDPTTLVWAERLDVPSVLEGIRRGRTVVKLQSPDDPTIIFDADAPIDGDTISADTVALSATVVGGPGTELRLVRDGLADPLLPVDGDAFETTWEIEAPETGESRYRVELFIDGSRRVVTSHLWLKMGPAPDDADGASGTDGSEPESTGDADGCGCTVRTHASPWAWLLVLCFVRRSGAVRASGRRR